VEMRQCPKYFACSASVCPLDPDWQKARYVNGDPVCYYMREAVKYGAELVFRDASLGELFDAVSVNLEPIRERWGAIDYKLAESCYTSMRMATVPPMRGG